MVTSFFFSSVFRENVSSNKNVGNENKGGQTFKKFISSTTGMKEKNLI